MKNMDGIVGFLRLHVRALRLPFTAASVLPYLAGLYLADGRVWTVASVCGLLAVAFAHLSCNLINDYADSQSGADWKDLGYFDGIFGGSKLIQAGMMSERRYFHLAVAFGIGCLAFGIVAGVVLGSVLFPVGCVAALALGWAYTLPPAALAYRRWGEPTIFLLFGPAAVFAGWVAGSGGTWPGRVAVLVALPFGLLTTAILVANEVPDYAGDIAVGKSNWVDWVGVRRAPRLYAMLMLGAAVFIVAGWGFGVMTPVSLFGAVLIVPVTAHSATILLHASHDKARLIVVSKLTILTQLLAGLFIILGVAS